MSSFCVGDLQNYRDGKVQGCGTGTSENSLMSKRSWCWDLQNDREWKVPPLSGPNQPAGDRAVGCCQVARTQRFCLGMVACFTLTQRNSGRGDSQRNRTVEEGTAREMEQCRDLCMVLVPFSFFVCLFSEKGKILLVKTGICSAPHLS